MIRVGVWLWRDRTASCGWRCPSKDMELVGVADLHLHYQCGH